MPEAANTGLKKKKRCFLENQCTSLEMYHFGLPGIRISKKPRGGVRGGPGCPYQNISFVYWRAGFVLHAASRGDKVRATRSTCGRNRKCCREHQLLLRRSSGWTGGVSRRGFGLPRRGQIKRLLCHVRQPTPPPPNPQSPSLPPPNHLKVLKCTGRSSCCCLPPLMGQYLHTRLM